MNDQGFKKMDQKAVPSEQERPSVQAAPVDGKKEVPAQEKHLPKI